MENPFDFFEKIYCINLNKRIDRWVKVKKEFEKIGILDKVERFNGIEKNDGRIGCIKSHLEIIKKAKKEGLNNVLVLEDDVTFVDEKILENLSKAISQLPKDFNLLYLGANIHYPLDSISDNLVVIKRGYSTHAICYNKNIFDVIIEKYETLNEIKTMEDILDVYLANQIQGNPNYKCYLVKPLLATQINDYSDIEKRKVDYNFIQERFKNFIK